MLTRCAWAQTPLGIAYHDAEWGVPAHDDRVLFEFITLEGAQAGLSWETILKKRDEYRTAFAGFDPAKVARFTPARIERLLQNPGIVRNRLKIESTISNARAFLNVQREFGTFDAYVWRFVGGSPRVNHPQNMKDVPARTAESDRVTGLDLGADDYVTKPFSLRELAARVRAVLRRRQQASAGGANVYAGAHLMADFDAVAIAVDGAPVRLTRREFELLRFLVENRNRVLSRDRLLERVWGYDRFIETRSVDVHVGRLRAKLGAAGQQIETVVGLGYRFVE